MNGKINTGQFSGEKIQWCLASLDATVHSQREH